MSPQHLRNLLHRFDPGAHGSCAPGIEEFAGPGRRTVGPEPLKILLEQVGADGSEVAGEQVRQPVHLIFGQVFRSFQQAPAAFFVATAGWSVLCPSGRPAACTANHLSTCS